MTHATGIELGPSSVVLVSARPGEQVTEVAAVQRFVPASNSARLSEALRFARRSGRLPRRARLVWWGLTAPSSPDDPARETLLRPFEDAGFVVEALLTPAEALARLAASRGPRHGAPVAWLSVNTHGGALAILDASEILYSRTITWKYNPAPRTPREQLLQRYVLVMHIAPEVQHGIALVASNHGKRVETVVTCGNLPDLRSLTMPLIEELDLEVETLDSSEGLRPAKAAATDILAEAASAVRLATAAAVMPMPGNRPSAFLPAVAAAALLIAGGWLAASALRLTANRSALPPVSQRGVDVRLPAPAPPSKPQSSVPAFVPPLTSAETPLPAASTGSDTASPAVGGLGNAAVVSQTPQQRSVRLTPVPAVTSILVAGGRRLALIGGEIVGVGDYIGPRRVIRIDQRSVVLRDPSGAEITVLLSSGPTDAVKSNPFGHGGRSPSTRTQAAR